MRGEGEEERFTYGTFKKLENSNIPAPEKNREGNTQYSVSIPYFSTYSAAGDW